MLTNDSPVVSKVNDRSESFIVSLGNECAHADVRSHAHGEAKWEVGIPRDLDRREVRAALERPSPVAAVYAVQKDHDRQVRSLRCAGRCVDRNIASLPQGLALESDEADAIRLEARVGYFKGSKR